MSVLMVVCVLLTLFGAMCMAMIAEMILCCNCGQCTSVVVLTKMAVLGLGASIISVCYDAKPGVCCMLLMEMCLGR